MFALILSLPSCKLTRFAVFNFANINDYKKFPRRDISREGEAFQFTDGSSQSFPDSLTVTKKGNSVHLSFEEYLEKNRSVAFLVIRNDTMLYEKYFKGYDRASIVASFSMAKSVTSLLIGCAIDDGYIKSIEEPVTNYLPQLEANGFGKITIKDVLNMMSGIDFRESYISPFGNAATYYYGRQLRKQVFKMKLINEPGSEFSYSSGDTELLGLILESALNGRTISSYLEEKIWKPLGMEYDASWSIDKKKNGIEKTFCCINARARDFAKIGRLMLNGGSWNGKQIVSRDWVENSTRIDTTGGSKWYYQYQWWIRTRHSYSARGYRGQFIYVNNEKNMIIVRLGKDHGPYGDWPGFFDFLAKNL